MKVPDGCQKYQNSQNQKYYQQPLNIIQRPSSYSYSSPRSLITRCLSTNPPNSFNSSVTTTSSSLYVKICLHIGHKPLEFSCSSHFKIQWRWKLWVQPDPRTMGQSSPGCLQLGQVPSKATRQIPQSSSITPPLVGRPSGLRFQCQVENPCHSVILTFMSGVFEMNWRVAKFNQWSSEICEISGGQKRLVWIMLYLMRVGECVGKFVVRKIKILTISQILARIFEGAVDQKDLALYKQ